MDLRREFTAQHVLADRRRFLQAAASWGPDATVDLGALSTESAAAARVVRKGGAVPLVQLAGLSDRALVPALLHMTRAQASVTLDAPWANEGPVALNDASLAELLYRALRHAESTGAADLRAALDACRGYRRILAGAPRDPTDPLDLRYDLNHAPAETPRLTFLVTRNCQLRCRYCMVKLWNEDAVDADHLRGVDVLFAGDADTVRMQFYGGEPLLRWPLIQQLVSRGRQLEGETGKRLAIILITNGILMTPEVAAFCRDHDVEVLLSLDGGPEVTNQGRLPHTRPPAHIARADGDTHGAARRALGVLKAAGARSHVILTITPDQAHTAAHGFAHVAGLGADMLQICYAMGVGWGAEATEVLCEQFGEIIHRHGDDIAAGRLTWVNLWRNEPVLIDTALQLETDGRVCFMNECMFEKYKQGRNYGVTHIDDIGDLRQVGSTRFHNYAMLTAIYGDRRPKYRDIMLDNLAVGEAVRGYLTEHLGDRLGGLPHAGET